MSMVEIAERRLVVLREKLLVRKRVVQVMVEVLQNIARHNDADSGAKFVLLGIDRDKYSILAGNPIRNEHIPALRHRLERINGLDQQRLRDLHKAIISTTEISYKGGAGLGLVDIACRSGEKLEWAFVPMNDDLSFFCLKVNIPASRSNSTVPC